MENLPLLKDIHMPPPDWHFPLGWIWPVLIAVAVLLYLLYRVWRYYQAKSPKTYALKLIDSYSENNLEDARKISEILRRICLLRFRSAAGLYNQEWISFLNRHSKQKIYGKAAQLLVYAPYMAQNNNFDAADFATLRDYAKAWVGENL